MRQLTLKLSQLSLSSKNKLKTDDLVITNVQGQTASNLN